MLFAGNEVTKREVSVKSHFDLASIRADGLQDGSVVMSIFSCFSLSSCFQRTPKV